MAVALLSSCGVTHRQSIIPRAVSTMNTVNVADLNFNRDDYEIFNTVTAEATVNYRANKTNTHIEISGDGDDFTLVYKFNMKSGWTCHYSGMMRAGYLGSDYALSDHTDVMVQPIDVVRRLATYRAIELAQQYGADAIVEPIVTSDYRQQGSIIVFHATVNAKLLKLKTR